MQIVCCALSSSSAAGEVRGPSLVTAGIPAWAAHEPEQGAAQQQPGLVFCRECHRVCVEVVGISWSDSCCGQPRRLCATTKAGEGSVGSSGLCVPPPCQNKEELPLCLGTRRAGTHDHRFEQE